MAAGQINASDVVRRHQNAKINASDGHLRIVVYQLDRRFYCEDDSGSQFGYEAPGYESDPRAWFDGLCERLRFKPRWINPGAV